MLGNFGSDPVAPHSCRGGAIYVSQASPKPCSLAASEVDSDSGETTWPEADADEPPQGLTPGGRDPVLGVKLPVGSSRQEKYDAQLAHMKAAMAKIDDITPPIGALPRMADIARHVASLGPSAVRRLRRKRMAQVRRLAKALRKESDDLIARADDHVASVLRAAGPGGVHVALIQRLLVDLGYEDGPALVACFLSGFGLIGDIIVAPHADECLVRDTEHSMQHVDQQAEELAAKFIKQQSAPVVGADEQAMRQDIFSKLRTTRNSRRVSDPSGHRKLQGEGLRLPPVDSVCLKCHLQVKRRPVASTILLRRL